MAERPDLDYARPRLFAALEGLACDGVWVGNPVVLRVMRPGPVEEHLVGRPIQSIRRRAHALHFSMDDTDLVVVPMLAGRFALAAPGEKRTADTVLAWSFGGTELRLRDAVRMSKVYVGETGAWASIPGLEAVGLDALDAHAFTLAAFEERIRGRREQVRRFLMDKSQIDALGNAYADEVLFEAGVHPKLRCNQLDDAQIRRLHEAVRTVLASAAAELERREPPLDVKLRDFLAVRNRKGEPCPRCGDAIRVAGVRGFDSFFCATCQPERRSGWIDWRKTRR